MLPSQELFRSIPCPYYVAGLCERPHCFFRHTKSDILLARKIEQGLLLEDGVSSDEDNEQSSTTNNNGPNKKPEHRLNSISNKITAAAANTVPPKVNLKPDISPAKEDIRKRPAMDMLELEGSTKKIRLRPDKNNITEIDHEAGVKKENLVGTESGSVSTKLLNDVSQVDQKLKKSSKERSHKTSSSSSRSSSSKSDRSKSRSSSNSPKKHSSSTSPKKDSSSTSITRSSRSKDKKYDKKDKRSQCDELNKVPKNSYNHPSTSDTKKTDLELEMKISELEYSNNIGGSSDDFRYPEISDYEDDPDEVAMECLRMFEEYKPTEDNRNTTDHGENLNKSSLSDKFEDSLNNMNNSQSNRRRTAHPGAVSQAVIIPKPPLRKPGPDLMSTMGRRLESQRKLIPEQTSSPTSSSAVNKKRIAHVPNVSGLLRSNSQSTSTNNNNTPQTLDKPPFSGLTAVDKSASTIAQTAIKGQHRTAHLPSQTLTVKKKRPIIVVDSPNRVTKIPNVIRQRFLDQIYDVCMKMYPSDPQSAFDKAITEENGIAVRCVSKQVYGSISATTIIRLRSELLKGPQPSQLEAPHARVANQMVSHDRNLYGAAADNISVIPKVDRESKFPEKNDLYKALSRYILTEEQLIYNGFPRNHPSGDKACAVSKSHYSNESYVYDDKRRTCERCKKVYDIQVDGTQVVPGNCTHHPGRKNSQRVGRAIKRVYTCCGDESGSSGCITVDFHVPKSLQTSKIRGFVSSVRDEGEEHLMGYDDWDIVALDCEMVNTTAGSELARATFVGKNNEILYDELVKPEHPVLDYNTQFSGLTEEDLKGVTKTLWDVQAVMLTEIKPNAILIGHSLESDLLALRFKHDCVIDTSVMFPHRNGPPAKRALRNLTSEYLEKIIQNSEAGHDSAEDARSALGLVYYKLHESIKLKEFNS